jgi:CRISPR/Cas system-associated exonuclease Cas4 (RecB family)
VLPASKYTSSSSESGLRGYNNKTWSAVSTSLNLSVSQVVSHYFCPRCTYIAFKEGRSFVNTLQTIEGQINHFVIEQLFASEAKLLQLISAQSRISYLDTVNTLLPDISESLRGQAEEKFGDSYKRLGGEFTIAWKKAEQVIRTRLYRVCANTKKVVPKRQFEIPLWSKDLALKGRLDLLENSTPLEIKTGKVPQQGCSYYHALQLTLYALLLENRHLKDVDYGYVYYASIHDKRVVWIDDSIREEAISQRDATLATLLGNVEPEGKCRQCMQRQYLSIIITSKFESVRWQGLKQWIRIMLLFLFFVLLLSIAILIISWHTLQKLRKSLSVTPKKSIEEYMRTGMVLAPIG